MSIKRYKNGRYVMKSNVSDESYHPDQKSITEDEAKKILITKAIYKAMEKVVEIEMEFPRGYHINDEICRDDKPSFNQWYLNEIGFDDTKLIQRFEETLKKHNLDLGFSE